VRKKIWIVLIIVINLYSKTINMILELNSVGSVLDTQTLLVYPKAASKILSNKKDKDEDKGVSRAKIFLEQS
jgi:hypothetical protein